MSSNNGGNGGGGTTDETVVVVNLVLSWTTVWSGDWQDCLQPQDVTCVGGYASAAALSRYYLDTSTATTTTSTTTSTTTTNNQSNLSSNTNHTSTTTTNANATTTTTSTLVLPWLDKGTPLVQMHPLGWSLNRLVLHNLLGWNVMLSSPSILTQNRVDFGISQRDISNVQTLQMPLLLTNVAVSPENSWYPYTEAVHFDATTGLAILAMDRSDALYHVDPINAARGILNYIRRINEESGCILESMLLFSQYVNNTNNNESTFTEFSNSSCWLPVIVYSDVNKELFDVFLPAIVLHEHPPALILDTMGSDSNFNVPTRIIPGGGGGGVWVHSVAIDRDIYIQHELSIVKDANGLPYLNNVTFTSQPFATMPPEAKDERFVSDVTFLRTLVNEALENDPVVGSSGYMPVQRMNDYRRCMGGECEMGNLFTDAVRWRTNADVAFITSGGLRGEGWPAGKIRVSNVWESLPFPNTICTGTFTGVSLFNVFNYSTSVATFQGVDTTTGASLLQVSGMRITYNTKLVGSRLVAIEILNNSTETDDYLPLERLRLYTFATDSFLCGINDPFPYLLGNGLMFEGEVKGVIGADLHQSVVADYLSQLDGPYNTSLQGRLINNTDVTEALNLVQTSENCISGSYWDEIRFTCETCPAHANVNFLAARVELEGNTGSNVSPTGHIDLVNSEMFNLSVSLKSVPSWVMLTGLTRVDSLSMHEIVVGQPTEMQPGERVSVNVRATLEKLETGTAVATVSFGVYNGGNFLGCPSQDVAFDVFLRVTPSEDLNQLGSISILGWTLAGIVVCTALLFSTWVIRNRKLRIVSTMQPIFLVAICVGVLIMGLSMIPLSIDDGVASERGSDIACMSIPWLFSMGFTIAQSALFSKLWRINKLFNAPQIRRMQVHEKDVVGPFAVLFALNFTVLLVFTVVDPLRYERFTVSGEYWNSYGRCVTDGPVGNTLLGLDVAVNLGAMISACYQAYKARNVSCEFSESTYLGIAMFSWIQLAVVGIPVTFLIDADNPIARYFIVVTLIFATCESMLLFIFVPMLCHARERRRNPETARRHPTNSRHTAPNASYVGRTRVSGIHIASDASTELNLRSLPSDGPRTSSLEQVKEEIESLGQSVKRFQEEFPDDLASSSHSSTCSAARLNKSSDTTVET